ncbi:MAG: protein of unknown function [Nitrospira sp.]
MVRTPLWKMAVVLAAALMTAGCPRILYLNYQPSTSLKGHGPVQVDAFVYSGHPTGLVKMKEVESSSKDVEALYLSQDIGVFFTNALRSELAFAGYELQPASARIASGKIEQFYLEYVGEQDQLFQIVATFYVAAKDGSSFTSSCRSSQRQPKYWMKTGLLIKSGITECVEQFMKAAQAAGAL